MPRPVQGLAFCSDRSGMRIARSRQVWLAGIAGLLAVSAGVPLAGDADEFRQHLAFSPAALGARVPLVRQERYVVNARIRPLALFWITRDDVGAARLTWRAGDGGHRAFELLVGSDPARTPRQINRWGFIVEEAHAGTVEVLGVMKGAAEETLDEATANADADRKARAGSPFGAVRTTVTGNRAVTGTMSFHAPPSLTYRDLDALLGLMPPAPREQKTIELPAGTKEGFLIAMTSMMAASIEPCRTGRGAKAVPALVYLYKRALYDLRLDACRLENELRTKAGVYRDVVDGRFEVRNRATGDATAFQVAYGSAAPLREVPVRIVFRPRWWMEAELLRVP